MGSWFSRDEESEVHNTGNTNNITISHPVEVIHDELLVLVGILVEITLINSILKCYKMHRAGIKKKYAREQLAV